MTIEELEKVKFHFVAHMSMEDEDYEPRKGFKCKEYFL